MKDNKLPYVFDLYYDIKNIDQLREELDYLQYRLEGLQSFINEYNIHLNK